MYKKINKEVQRKLGVTPDGLKGPNTVKAIKAFQKSKGLNPDGIVGPKTLKALGIVVLQNPNNLPNKNVKLRKTSRPIKEIIVHCTATPEGREVTVKEIDRWHKQRWPSGIGYHYIVHLDGSVSIGRPVNKRGVHVRGRNTGTIGVVYVGGVKKDGRTPKDTRTPAQKKALYKLVSDLVDIYKVPVTGHNQYAAKACPSFDVRKDPLGKL